MQGRCGVRNRESHSRKGLQKPMKGNHSKKRLNRLPIWMRVKAIARRAIQTQGQKQIATAGS